MEIPSRAKLASAVTTETKSESKNAILLTLKNVIVNFKAEIALMRISKSFFKFA